MKILVVEDDVLIGMDLALQLNDLGHATSGPYRTPAEALEAIAVEAPDLALLDINLGGGVTSLPVAETLLAAEIPFIFLTGYSHARYSQIEAIRDAPKLLKPVSRKDLVTGLADAGVETPGRSGG